MIDQKAAKQMLEGCLQDLDKLTDKLKGYVLEQDRAGANSIQQILEQADTCSRANDILEAMKSSKSEDSQQDITALAEQLAKVQTQMDNDFYDTNQLAELLKCSWLSENGQVQLQITQGSHEFDVPLTLKSLRIEGASQGRVPCFTRQLVSHSISQSESVYFYLVRSLNCLLLLVFTNPCRFEACHEFKKKRKWEIVEIVRVSHCQIVSYLDLIGRCHPWQSST